MPFMLVYSAVFREGHTSAKGRWSYSEYSPMWYQCQYVRLRVFVCGDIEAELAPKINPKIRDLNFTTLA
jgi:hypothetical protein